jgi:hypothetical protein
MSDPGVKVYIITFGVKDVNLAALNQYLFDSADIIAFWNYVPLVYCVKSRLTATTLTLKLRPFFPQETYFVAEINPKNVDGLLPLAAWEWFYLDHHDKHRAPALPPANWNALLGQPGGGASPYDALRRLAGPLSSPGSKK